MGDLSPITRPNEGFKEVWVKHRPASEVLPRWPTPAFLQVPQLRHKSAWLSRDGEITWSTHAPFAALAAYMILLAACENSPDWELDLIAYGCAWVCAWAGCTAAKASARTAGLLAALPVPHLTGALGAYHWSVGNWSYDVAVHVVSSFVGGLLLASVTDDCLRKRNQESLSDCTSGATSDSKMHGLASALLLGIVLLSCTAGVEGIEALAGSTAARRGEGVFLRGAGDDCLPEAPCSEATDSAKDMLDNGIGAGMACLALAARTPGATGMADTSKIIQSGREPQS